MARLNNVQLIGYLTADPELKQTQGGVSVTSFQIGVSRRRTANNQNPPSDFPTIVAWRSTAEFISRYFRKGDPILIIGEIKTRSWDDQNGNKRYATEVEATEASFVESKQNIPPAYGGQAAPSFADIKDDNLPFG